MWKSIDNHLNTLIFNIINTPLANAKKKTL